jgi:hypothetical protein
MEATMGDSLHIRGPFTRPAQGASLFSREAFRPALVSDWGEDHEMTEDFGNSLARTGDRMVGFVAGAAIFAMVWAAWMLI